MKKIIKTSVITGTVAVIAIIAVMFACSKEAQEPSVSEVCNVKVEKAAPCPNPVRVNLPSGGCVEFCIDCKGSLQDYMYKNANGQWGMEPTIYTCDGRSFTFHIEYRGPMPGNDHELADPNNWQWAQGSCGCLSNAYGYVTRPDEVIGAWFDALCQVCPQFCF